MRLDTGKLSQTGQVKGFFQKKKHPDHPDWGLSHWATTYFGDVPNSQF